MSILFKSTEILYLCVMNQKKTEQNIFSES